MEKERYDRQKKIINLLCGMALLVVVFPLLILGFYNYPSADDWNYGAALYQKRLEGGTIFAMLRESVRVVGEYRGTSESRFVNAFLGTLQPGIWGERWYFVTPWLMIGSLIFSEMIFVNCLLSYSNKQNRQFLLPILFPSLILQILCVPFPVESFYWWTGAVNYTFIFAMSLLLHVVYFKIFFEENKRGYSYPVLLLCGIILAVIVGGDSYAASLSTGVLVAILSLLLVWKKPKAVMKSLPVTIALVGCLVFCVLGEGNQQRLVREFDGTTNSLLTTISLSLQLTLRNIVSWSSWKIYLMVLMMIPFMRNAVKKVEYRFSYPVIFTVLSFGVYASQIAANVYAAGDTGGRRMADVLYYAYHIWVLLNIGYWVGWLVKKDFSFFRKVCVQRTAEWTKRYTVSGFCFLGVLLAVLLIVRERRDVSTYQACVWLEKGYAREYAKAWEERLKILHDPNEKIIYFDPLPGDEVLIFYTDLKQGENWVNDACALYYDKEYVGLSLNGQTED